MKKKRHSGIFQAFWPMKVEAKSAKHVTNIASEATSKKKTLGSNALRAFGKYTRLLLLSTHLCKNLLKPLRIPYRSTGC